MTAYPYGYAPSAGPSQYQPSRGNQFRAPHAYNAQRSDFEAGYVPAYYPGQGYSTGAAGKKHNAVPWWTIPDNYPDRRLYYEGPGWTGNSRFEGTYVSDSQIPGNGPVMRRTWEETVPPDNGNNAEGWYRYNRGQKEVPQFRSPDVVDDVEETKKQKDWLWRRVAVQSVNELTPKVLDGGYIQRYGYIK